MSASAGTGCTILPFPAQPRMARRSRRWLLAVTAAVALAAALSAAARPIDRRDLADGPAPLLLD
ncbi:MAG TPA: hypothetical protein VLU43_07410 [Anaeromyxobacteraceae bacterium]|nr:hypothetical protein [Anaeromyxobacteraceae bacterium]